LFIQSQLFFFFAMV